MFILFLSQFNEVCSELGLGACLVASVTCTSDSVFTDTSGSSLHHSQAAWDRPMPGDTKMSPDETNAVWPTHPRDVFITTTLPQKKTISLQPPVSLLYLERGKLWEYSCDIWIGGNSADVFSDCPYKTLIFNTHQFFKKSLILPVMPFALLVPLLLHVAHQQKGFGVCYNMGNTCSHMFLVFIKLSYKRGSSCRDHTNYLFQWMVEIILYLRKCVQGFCEVNWMAGRGELEFTGMIWTR